MDSPDPPPHPSAYAYNFSQSANYPAYYHQNAYPAYSASQSGPGSWNQPIFPPHTPFPPPQPAFQHFHNTFAPHVPETPPRQPLSSSQPHTMPTATSSRKRSSEQSTTDLRSRGGGANKRTQRSNIENLAPPLSQFSGVPSTDTSDTSHSQRSASPDAQHPVFTAFTSILPKGKKSTKIATDVWFFVQQSETKEKPAVVNPMNEILLDRPKDCSFLACPVCTGKEWHSWSNGGGQTEKIRKHLHESHWPVYREFVLQHRLKGWERIAQGIFPECVGGAASTSAMREQFTQEGFYRCLVEWIVTNDQAPNVTDCKEFRELLLHISPHLTEDTLPHRSKTTQLIIEHFQEEYKKLQSKMQASPSYLLLERNSTYLIHPKSSKGRISYTSDVWSRNDLSAFMAVTAHYLITVEGRLTLRNQLVAFRHLQGSHTGENLADVFFHVLEELLVLDKMGMVTLDNASNNNTLMTNLKSRFQAKGIPFDEQQNHVRCFLHVVNIAAKTGLKYLMKIADIDREIQESALLDDFIEELNADIDWAYSELLAGDIIGAARKLVTACRASGKRREALETIIKEGNIQNWFKDAKGNPYSLDILVLLRDIETRWSSILFMIDWLLQQYPAVKVLLAQPEHADIADYALNNFQLSVLSDVRHFLNVFHVAQQVVSAEKTPTLSIVVPVYENLIVGLTSLKRHLPQLKHAISASIKKLEEYMSKARNTKMYILAMLINLQIKLNWAETHWGHSEINQARGWINEAMLERQRSIRMAQAAITISEPVPLRRVSIPSHAAQAQTLGMSNLTSLVTRLGSSDSLDDDYLTRPSTPPVVSNVLSDQDAQEEDQAAILEELQKWTSSGIMTKKAEVDAFDLVRYWESKETDFPILYRIALDVIPIQASAVPCERAFSSSKETDTNRRSGLGAEFMEVLQMYKYLVRGHRLDFMKGMLATEEECAALDISTSTLDNLLISGNIEALEALISSSY